MSKDVNDAYTYRIGNHYLAQWMLEKAKSANTNINAN